MKNRYLHTLFVCWMLVVAVSGSHAQTVASDEIGIAVPAAAITRMINAALPIQLENGPHIKGALWIDAIDHFKIGSDELMFDMNIRGNNIKLETQLGKKTLLMDIGNVNASFSCKVSFRYDATAQLLYITPYLLQKPDENKSDELATSLLQLISLANGTEYPIEIQKFEPLVARISDDQFNIGMAITRIYSEKNRFFINGKATLKKTTPMELSPKKSD